MRKFLYILAGFLGLIALVVPSYFLGKKHYSRSNNKNNYRADENSELYHDEDVNRYSKNASFSPSSGVKVQNAYYVYEPKYDAFSSVTNPEQLCISLKLVDDTDSLDVSCLYLTKIRICFKSNEKELAYFSGKEFVDLNDDRPYNAFIYFDNDKCDQTYFVNKGKSSTSLDFNDVQFVLEYTINPEYRPEGLTIEYKSFEIVSSELLVHATFKNNTGTTIKKITELGIVVTGINYDYGFNWDEYTDALVIPTYEFTGFTQGSSCDDTFTFPSHAFNHEFFNSDLSGAYITMYYEGTVSRY